MSYRYMIYHVAARHLLVGICCAEPEPVIPLETSPSYQPGMTSGISSPETAWYDLGYDRPRNLTGMTGPTRPLKSGLGSRKPSSERYNPGNYKV